MDRAILDLADSFECSPEELSNLSEIFPKEILLKESEHIITHFKQSNLKDQSLENRFKSAILGIISATIRIKKEEIAKVIEKYGSTACYKAMPLYFQKIKNIDNPDLSSRLTCLEECIKTINSDPAVNSNSTDPSMEEANTGFDKILKSISNNNAELITEIQKHIADIKIQSDQSSRDDLIELRNSLEKKIDTVIESINKTLNLKTTTGSSEPDSSAHNLLASLAKIDFIEKFNKAVSDGASQIEKFTTAAEKLRYINIKDQKILEATDKAILKLQEYLRNTFVDEIVRNFKIIEEQSKNLTSASGEIKKINEAITKIKDELNSVKINTVNSIDSMKTRVEEIRAGRTYPIIIFMALAWLSFMAHFRHINEYLLWIIFIAALIIGAFQDSITALAKSYFERENEKTTKGGGK